MKMRMMRKRRRVKRSLTRKMSLMMKMKKSLTLM
jgi:hypothetical protein